MEPGGQRLAQGLFALGLLALGSYVGFEAASLPAASGHAGVGPRLFPGLVAGGLILVAVALGWQVAAGRGGAAAPLPALDAGPLSWVVLGLALQYASIPLVGFMLASTLLFAAVARAFDSTRRWLDLLIGLALCVAIQIGFTWGLGLKLPFGMLERLWR